MYPQQNEVAAQMEAESDGGYPNGRRRRTRDF